MDGSVHGQAKPFPPAIHLELLALQTQLVDNDAMALLESAYVDKYK